MALELIERFHDDCMLRGLAPNTCMTYAQRMGLFTAYLNQEGKDLLEVDESDLKDFLAHLRKKNLKKRSMNLIFSAISAFYKFAKWERLVSTNPVPEIQERYLRSYKDEVQERHCISIEEASKLVNSVLDSRDRAIIILLLKTGIRRHELLELDLSDINLEVNIITLKPTPKRSNRTRFFDEEVNQVLDRWLKVRSIRKSKSEALFIGPSGDRLTSTTVERVIIRHATRVGLHDPGSKRPEDRFSPHCCRHWFTTHLIRAGMPREYVKELRGDARHDAIDLYNHIDKEELKKSYQAHIPQLGI